MANRGDEQDDIFWPGVQSKIARIDNWLDGEVAQVYKDQPLAQDIMRVIKETEEKGEAIAELILATGQNPRKGRDPEAAERLLDEMADRAWTIIFGMQHFTKDASRTEEILMRKLNKLFARIPEEYR